MLYIMIFVLLMNTVFSLLVGVYASHKGRSGGSFFLLSLFVSPLIGFFVAVLVKNKSNEIKVIKGLLKSCPFCAELIKPQAIVCHYCGKDIKNVTCDEKLKQEYYPR